MDNKEKNIGMVMYADDGILYSTSKFEPSPPSNLKFYEGKSRWLKKDNEWLTPFRFLGLEYDGEGGTVKGNTRKGSHLEVDAKRRSNVFTLIRALRKVYYEDNDLEAISNSYVFGLFIYKLYCGS